MATSTMINVGPQFNMDNFLKQLASLYQSRGFMVTTIPFGTNASVKFDKNTGGINMLLGLGQGVTANCTLNNNVLVISYSDEDWVGKIVGLAVGWLLCMIPFITAIIGIVKQLQLTKDISSDATMIAASNGGVSPINMGNFVPNAPVAVAAAPQGVNTAAGAATNMGAVAHMAPVTAAPVASAPANQGVQVVEETKTIVETAVWSCSCGANGNTGTFCGKCGSPRS